MKKILFILTFTLFTTSIHAQGSNSYYLEPARFEIVNTGANPSLFTVIVDTQTGLVKCISNGFKVPETYYVNENDLTNGTPTKDGRFRICCHAEREIKLIDTENGRCWKIDLRSKDGTFQLISESMLKK